jgi:hypothetical protein
MSNDHKQLHIVPSRHLLPYLGNQDYFFPDALAELVDNSIDSFSRMEKEDRASHTVEISFKVNGDKIHVKDNAEGMSLIGLEEALRIASAKEEDRKLGFFGIGLKAATTSLGRKFTILTSKKGDKEIFRVDYDEKRWLKNEEDQDWAIDYSIQPKIDPSLHFTTIEISDLKVTLHAYRQMQLFHSFGLRYGPFLKDKSIKILINGGECKPVEYTLLDGKHPIGENGEITLQKGRKIRGWIGLLEKSSQKGLYGIHLRRNDRLITVFDKELLRPREKEEMELVEGGGHPTLARIIGELEINHVPVNLNKRKFIFESEEWQEVKAALWKDPTFVNVIRQSRKLAQERKEKRLPTTTIKKLDSLSVIVSDNPQAKLTQSGEVSPPDSLSVSYNFADLEPDGPPYKYFIKEKNIDITINKNFPGFTVTKDKYFYSVFWIIDAIATEKAKGNFGVFLKERDLLFRKISNLAKNVRENK